MPTTSTPSHEAVNYDEADKQRSFAFSRGLWGPTSDSASSSASSTTKPSGGPLADPHATASQFSLGDPHSTQQLHGNRTAAPSSQQRATGGGSANGSIYSYSLDAAGTKFADSQVFRDGGIAWGTAIVASSSASGSRRPSHALTEPDSAPLARPLAEFPRRASVNGPPQHPPFLSSLMPLTSMDSSNQSNGSAFPGPSISIMDQFGSLVEATRQAELSHHRRSSSKELQGSVPARYQSQSQHGVSPTHAGTGSHTNLAGLSHLGMPNSHHVHVGGSKESSPLLSSRSPYISSASASPAPAWTPPSRVPSAASLSTLLSQGRAPTTAGLDPLTSSSRHYNVPGTPIGVGNGSPGGSLGGPPVLGSATQNLNVQGGPYAMNTPNGTSNGNIHPNEAMHQRATDSDLKFASSDKKRPGARKKDWKRNKRYDSPFLEELRTNSRNVDISQVIGHVAEVAADQHGSRFLQEHLPTASPQIRAELVAEALENASTLIVDVFGNYVIQILFEVATPEQRSQLVQVMQGKILTYSVQMYGCRVVQMAIKYSSVDLQVEIVEELRSHIVRCVKDHNGNHVIQKSIECIPPEHVKFLYEAVMAKTVELAKHSYGCRVVQRILEHGDVRTRSTLLDELRQHVAALTQDRYGNYVIQHIVDNGPVEERDFVFDQLLPNVVALSTHKYASNVVEKAFIMGTPRQRSLIINQVLSEEEKGTPAIASMIKDQYANYVIQKILDTTKGEDHDRLTNAIRPHLAGLKRSSYGKHLASIERLMNELSTAVT